MHFMSVGRRRWRRATGDGRHFHVLKVQIPRWQYVLPYLITPTIPNRQTTTQVSSNVFVRSVYMSTAALAESTADAGAIVTALPGLVSNGHGEGGSSGGGSSGGDGDEKADVAEGGVNGISGGGAAASASASAHTIVDGGGADTHHAVTSQSQIDDAEAAGGKLARYFVTLGDRIQLVRDLIDSITLKQLNQENICCLNTALVFLMHAERHAEVPAMLEALKVGGPTGAGSPSSPGSSTLETFAGLVRFWKVFYGTWSACTRW
jgi:hypothetical protein